MIVGLDFKAAATREKMVLNNIPIETPIRVLLNTFGNALSFVEKLVGAGYLDIIVDSVWRNDHAMGTDEFNVAASDLEWLNELSTNPQQQIYFCPYLEHRLSGKELREDFKEFVRLANDCIYIVNNPLRQGQWLNMEGVINCAHHDDRPSGDPRGFHNFYIYSEDGKDSKNRNVQQILNREKRKGAEIGLVWMPQMNLQTDAQYYGHAPMPAPKDRDPRNMPVDLLKAAVVMCDKRGRHKGKGVWKAYAEHKNTPPTSRELKPAYLSQTYYDEVFITNVKSKAKNKLQYSGREHGTGRHIYRYDKYGYEKTLSNIRQTGKPTSILWGMKGRRKEKLATFNPAYRLGSYK